MNILGEKTVLTTFVDSDIGDTYINWLNDKYLMRYSNQRFLQHDKQSCKKYLGSFKGTKNSFLKISDISSGVMIGTFTIYRNFFHRTADIGILIGDASFSRKGFGSDAWTAALNYLLFNERVRKVTAGASSLNLAMINMMHKSGMHLECTRVNQEVIDGFLTDVLLYARYS